MKIGLPAGAQSAVFSISNLVTQAAINTLGTNVMAGSSAAFNLEVIAYYVFNAFTQACTTFVGQNYGAGQLDRCKKTLRCAYVEDALATGAAIALVLAAGRTLLALFNRDPEVIACGYTRLVVIFFAYAFSMTYEMITGYLHGFGISMVPAVLTMLGVCGVRIVWVYTAFAAKKQNKIPFTPAVQACGGYVFAKKCAGVRFFLRGKGKPCNYRPVRYNRSTSAQPCAKMKRENGQT